MNMIIWVDGRSYRQLLFRIIILRLTERVIGVPAMNTVNSEIGKDLDEKFIKSNEKLFKPSILSHQW